MKILLVEDDAVSLKLVSTVLEKEDYEIIIAKTGKDALGLLKTDTDIEIIVSDIMMPEMDGFKLLNYVKSSPKLMRMPVILTTAMNDKSTVIKSIEMGAAGFVTKPIDQKALLAQVKKAVESIPGSILVVDDEDLIRNVLSRIITRAGFKTTLVSNGDDALSALEKQKISVVLSDMKMPGMSGLELLEKVKEKFPKIPVLVMSGNQSEFNKNNLISAGADGYIEKPFNNTDIILKLRSLIK